MYILTTDVNGRLRDIENTAKGSRFRAQPASRDYRDMLAWIRREMDPHLDVESELPADSTLFLTRHALTTHFRRHGFLLFATPDGEVPYWDVSHHGDVDLCYLSVVRSGSHLRDPVSVVPHQTRFALPMFEWVQMNAELKSEESDVRHISSTPVSRVFLYLDISDFSRYSSIDQALVINSLTGLVNTDTLWSEVTPSLFHAYQDVLSIGDGYIFVFTHAATATRFAAHLASLIETQAAAYALPIEFHFRMGAHVGAVYSFWDPGRERWNYVGDGINGGNRVLAAVGKDQDDVVFVSSDIRKAIQSSLTNHPDGHEILASFTNRGRKADKHGRPWRVYEVNHTALAGQPVARTGKT
jgi:hypothetical protein